ncbi:hypothetical protein [Sphingomonas alba]|uniref:Uncharacterized protein n=1 Tax=Sphingomonas alba TaxID=2908208 RepID=A0ABT0RK22_9SPHN|nr:hypothetical protein [Sphingomonas alba]MCL6682890.1 hypothetical protein [Sphingomonas alba]
MQKARFDWLAELCGAGALAAATGYAALKIAPSFALAPPMAMTAAGFAGFVLGALAMRLVKPGARNLPISGFALADVEGEDWQEPLLLDTVYEEPLLLEYRLEEEELLLVDLAEGDSALLLVDALQRAEPESRVVQLFAHQPMPTPGQLKERIDRHLADAPRHPSPMPAPDASQALYAALNELKRSLR